MATTTENLQPTAQTGPVVTLTPEAYKVVREAINQEPDPSSLALWLEVRGVQAGSFIYDLYFQALSDADEGDVRHAQDDIEVVVPAGSVERLRGARLEWSEEGGGGLVLVNPNSPAPEEVCAQRAFGDPRQRHHQPPRTARGSRYSSSRSIRPSPATAGGPTSSP